MTNCYLHYSALEEMGTTSILLFCLVEGIMETRHLFSVEVIASIFGTSHCIFLACAVF